MLKTLLVLGLTVPSARAGTPLRLEDAFKEMLQHHPRLKAAQARVDGAREYARGVGSQPNPLLRLGDTLGQPVEEVNSVSQRLELGGQPRLREKAATAERDGLEQDRLETRRQMLRETSLAYYGLWQEQQRRSLAENRVELAQRLEKIAQRRLQVGEIPANQHLRVQLEVARAEADLATAKATEASAQARLSAAMGRPQPTPEILAEAPKELPEAPPLDLPELDSPAKSQLDTLPAIQRGQQDIAKAQTLTDLARKANSPDMYLSAYRSRLYDSNSVQGIQLSISLPLWDWGSIGAEVQKREHEREALQYDLEARKLQLSLELRQAWETYAGAKARRDILREQARQFQRLSGLAQKGYDSGFQTLLEVIDAQQTYRAALQDYIVAEAAVRTTRIDLELAAGGNLVTP